VFGFEIYGRWSGDNVSASLLWTLREMVISQEMLSRFEFTIPVLERIAVHKNGLELFAIGS
jgi:hypothetical protein